LKSVLVRSQSDNRIASTNHRNKGSDVMVPRNAATCDNLFIDTTLAVRWISFTYSWERP
jgi:hypothetical protein